jgi:hypothetical protein
MGFKDVRQSAIKAIEEGRVQHELREKIDEKNVLLTGRVTPGEVVQLLRACRGTQYVCVPHHLVRNIDVHVFKPEARLRPEHGVKRWYIKLYFLEPDVWFISVHESEKG